MLFVLQISESIPLVGDLEALGSLENEYNEDPVYLLKVKDLSSKYKYIRRTRPDGNCFFRAFSYAYLEHLLTDKAEYDKFFEIAKNSKEILVRLGFSQFTVEDFYETVSLSCISNLCSHLEKSRTLRHTSASGHIAI